jgi:Na+/proline symporter
MSYTFKQQWAQVLILKQTCSFRSAYRIKEVLMKKKKKRFQVIARWSFIILNIYWYILIAQKNEIYYDNLIIWVMYFDLMFPPIPLLL